jgi:hypothetical protein
MSIDERPVLIIVTANNCSSCARFEPFWVNSIKAKLYNTGLIRVPIEIKVSKIGLPVPIQYPKDLNRYVGFYPSLILVTGRSWNNAMAKRELMLEAMVFNGAFVNGRMVPVDEKASLNESVLLEWLKREVKIETKSNIETVETKHDPSNFCSVEFRPRPAGYFN